MPLSRAGAGGGRSGSGEVGGAEHLQGALCLPGDHDDAAQGCTATVLAWPTVGTVPSGPSSGRSVS